jgi:hypothetical protein
MIHQRREHRAARLHAALRRPAGGPADPRPAGTISEDIEKCGGTIYLLYAQCVAANRRINDRTLLVDDGVFSNDL